MSKMMIMTMIRFKIWVSGDEHSTKLLPENSSSSTGSSVTGGSPLPTDRKIHNPSPISLLDPQFPSNQLLLLLLLPTRDGKFLRASQYADDALHCTPKSFSLSHPSTRSLKQSPKPSDSAAPTVQRGDAAFSTPQRVQSSCAPITTTTTQSKPSGCVTVSSSKTVRFAPSQAAEYEREAPTGAGVKRLSPDQAAQLYPVVVEPSQDVDDLLRIRQQTKDNHAILSAWDESFEDFIFQDDDDDIDRTPTVFSKRKRRTSKMFSPKPKNLLLDTETKEENALFPSDIKDDYDSSKSSPPTDSAGEVLHSNIADIIKQITQFMSNYSTTDFLYLLDATYSSSSSSLQNSDTLVRVIHEIENACDKMEVSAHVVPQELHGSLFLLSYKSLLQLEIDALSKVHSELSNQIHQVHQSSRDLTELETNVFQRTGNLPDLIRREHNAVCSLHCKYRSTKKHHSALLWGLTSDIHRSLVIAPHGNDADESLVVHLSSFGGSFITEIHWDLLGDVVHIRPYLPEDLPCLCLYQAFHSCLFYSYFDTNIPYLEKLSVSDCVQYIKLFLNRLEVATRDIQGLDKLCVKQVSYGSTHIEVQLLLPDEHHVKVTYTNRPSLTTSCRPIEAVLSGKSGSRAVRIPSDLYPLQSLVQQLHMTDHDV